MPPFDVRGRRAIVTGGANGIGLEFARRLLADGASVCVSDIAVEAGESAVKELRRMSGVGKDRLETDSNRVQLI